MAATAEARPSAPGKPSTLSARRLVPSVSSNMQSCCSSTRRHMLATLWRRRSPSLPEPVLSSACPAPGGVNSVRRQSPVGPLLKSSTACPPSLVSALGSRRTAPC
eukprot:3635437-Lingulodinium_polyedra.AAC.1